jgi:hypothetical protein
MVYDASTGHFHHALGNLQAKPRTHASRGDDDVFDPAHGGLS